MAVWTIMSGFYAAAARDALSNGVEAQPTLPLKVKSKVNEAENPPVTGWVIEGQD